MTRKCSHLPLLLVRYIQTAPFAGQDRGGGVECFYMTSPEAPGCVGLVTERTREW